MLKKFIDFFDYASLTKLIVWIIILGFIVYFNALYGTFVWDDEAQILKNIPVHSIANLFTFFQGGNFYAGSEQLSGIYYKPLLSTMFSLIYSIFGPSAGAFHFFQISFHLANTVLTFLLFKKFFPKTLAFFASLLFLVHPINTEAVIFISAFQDVLFMFFGLSSLHLVITKNMDYKIGILLFFLLLFSLLSKEAGILFVTILPIYTFLFARNKIWQVAFIDVLVFLTYMFLRLGVAGIPLYNSINTPIMQFSLVERMLTMPKIFLHYLRVFLFPKDLAIAQHWVVTKADFPGLYLPLVIDLLIIIVIIGVFVWLRSAKKDWKLYLFFSLWFFIGMLLHIQLFPLDMTVAERWFYFPIVGLLGMILVVLKNMSSKKDTIKVLLIICTFVAISALSIRVIIRNNNWSTALKLYENDVKISQNSVHLEENLGTEYYRTGDLDRAEYHFKRAVELEPRIGQSWYNLAVVAGKRKDFDLAKNYYKKAIDESHFYLAYENLSVISFAYGSLEETEQITQQALTYFPKNTKLWLILALTENKLQKHEQALAAANNAYKLSPNEYNQNVYNLILQKKSVPDPEINFE